MNAPASIPDTATATADALGSGYIPRYAQYELWASERRNCPHLADDAATAAARWLKMQSESAAPAAEPADQSKPAETKTRRGRPALSTENPIVSLMPLLSLDNPSWFDDILRGSIASSAGTHKGQLNVRVSDVKAALYLGRISVAAVKRPDMEDRTARSIAQAARHAAHGIDLYLNRHPYIRARLVEEAKLEHELAADVSIR